jgi:hypothetical protein
MKLTWTEFSGIRPKADERLLPDGNAQVAENITTERGGMRPLAGLLDVVSLAKNNTQTIYRFGQALNSSTQFWFHWTTDVDVAKGPIANDTSERTYWTGDGVPKYTNAAVGTTGTNLPAVVYPLGVPAPEDAAIATATGTAPDGASTETRVYIYTFVTQFGEESAPSPTVAVNILVGQSVILTDMSTAASNSAILSTKRIYRAQRGVYLFVAEVAAATTTYTDAVTSDILGEPCPSVNWDTPSDAMYALKAGPNGMMAALDGYTVRLSEPFRPHAWPMDYAQTVEFPGVGIGQFAQSFVILTTGYPFILTGSHPSNVSMAPAKFYQPCLSKRSIVSAAGDVIWASPDGLVSLGGSGENNLTEAVFTPDQWRVLRPETMRGSWHEGWYVGSYDPGTGRRSFMFRPATQEWVDLPSLAIDGFYRDTVGDALYVLVDDTVKKFRAGAPLVPRWKSNKQTTSLMDFVAARVTGTYPITFRLYRDGNLLYTNVVTSDEPFKLPAGIGRTWEIELSGPVVLGAALATSEIEL